MARWTVANIPSQSGRSAVVTGTGGLGYEIALGLARAECAVIIAGRNPEKGRNATARIRREVPSATIEFEVLDLASIRSIDAFGAKLRQQRGCLDLLVNNAGVMVPPERQATEDGFELQFGTNYLGHFALTQQLLPVLTRGKGSRVVTVSSIAARGGSIDFHNLNAERAYQARKTYAQSKLACLMFALELQRRSDLGGWGIASIAAHPGVSRTDLLLNAPGRFSLERISRTLLPFAFQPAAQGALPVLYAATASDAKGGAYYGPAGMSETRGYPADAKIPAAALNEADATRLWDISEMLVAKQRWQSHRVPGPHPHGH
ncbi:SDR family oxidoreductase [Belnapia sp. T18]|uniref:SDR family oxidoreductase n=1 Tax=Belnapia arida TaxID=2804533 RepID=A0ABS1UEK5_9PROT|nr:SDR family oxidoreductase [Belnapia arida]MBL6081701.1 SDR family oxidoreductase [Belnapia arida]